MKYIFIINLNKAINIDILFYKIDQVFLKKSMTKLEPKIVTIRGVS